MPERRLSLLLSFAHPDDETFMAAGTIRRYLDEGVQVALVCGTRGEEGTPGDPPLCSHAELGAFREQELRNAMAAVGLTELHFLGYHDRHFGDAPADRVREQLVSCIRQFRPQVVMTFDPNGANLHPDHVAISRFTSDAIGAAADARWFPELGAAHQVDRLVWQTPMYVWQLSRTERLAEQPGVDFLFDVSRWRDQKSTALRAHGTQQKGISRLFFEPADSAEILSLEGFRQAWGPPLVKRPSDDLFDGLR